MFLNSFGSYLELNPKNFMQDLERVERCIVRFENQNLKYIQMLHNLNFFQKSPDFKEEGEISDIISKIMNGESGLAVEYTRFPDKFCEDFNVLLKCVGENKKNLGDKYQSWVLHLQCLGKILDWANEMEEFNS